MDQPGIGKKKEPEASSPFSISNKKQKQSWKLSPRKQPWIQSIQSIRNILKENKTNKCWKVEMQKLPSIWSALPFEILISELEKEAEAIVMDDAAIIASQKEEFALRMRIADALEEEI